MGNEYRIPEENLPGLLARLEKLQKRAAKLGCAGVSWRELGTESVVLVDSPGGPRREESPAYVPAPNERIVAGRVYHLVRVDGPRPVLNGWRFVAVLQHGEDDLGTIVRTVPGVSDAGLERFRTAGPWCEHCRANRYRTDTYVVRHDDGRVAQVGSTCIRDFTGHESPAEAARQASFLIEAASIASASEDDEWLGGGGRKIRDYEALEVLTLTIAATARYGWCSRGTARDDERKVATADRVTGYLAAKPADRDEEMAPTAEHRERAAEMLDWAREHFAEMGMSGISVAENYVWNLRVVTQHDWIGYREVGLLASLARYWERETGRRLRERLQLEQRAASQHFGALKQRDVWTATVLSATPGTGSYGRWGERPVTYVRFLVGGRDLAFWKASGSRELDWPIGESFEVKATVISHDLDRDGKTLVTRLSNVAKLGPAEEPAPPPPSAPAVEFTAEQRHQFEELAVLARPYSVVLAAITCADCGARYDEPSIPEAKEFLRRHAGHATALDVPKWRELAAKEAEARAPKCSFTRDVAASGQPPEIRSCPDPAAYRLLFMDGRLSCVRCTHEAVTASVATVENLAAKNSVEDPWRIVRLKVEPLDVTPAAAAPRPARTCELNTTCQAPATVLVKDIGKVGCRHHADVAAQLMAKHNVTLTLAPVA